jgi:hypothetical protein
MSGISDMGAPLPINAPAKEGPKPPALHQAVDPDQFKKMSSPTTIFRGDAGMHSPDLGYGEEIQLDVQKAHSGRIV